MKCTALALIFILVMGRTIPGRGQSGNKATARYYFEEVVNRQDLKGLSKVFADSFVVHVLLDSTETKKSIADQADFLRYFFKAFPDVHYSIGDVLESDNRIAMRVIFSGTHNGEFWGYPPPGNHIKYLSEIFFFRFKRGKVEELWVQLDLYNLFRQLKNSS
ncbi:MAG TPA: ester cyclase [Puia sp.]|nr:ester cyclase [Puia sp.]